MNLIYDSVLQVNQQKQAISGEIRLATRTGHSTPWSYRTLDTSNGAVAVAGYALSLNKTADGVIASWLTASRISIPRPTQIRWENLSKSTLPNTITTDKYGLPTSPMSIENRTLIFGCESRICAVDFQPSGGKATIRLISNALHSSPAESAWVIVNRVRYAVTSVAGQITLLRP